MMSSYLAASLVWGVTCQSKAPPSGSRYGARCCGGEAPLRTVAPGAAASLRILMICSSVYRLPRLAALGSSRTLRLLDCVNSGWTGNRGQGHGGTRPRLSLGRSVL